MPTVQINDANIYYEVQGEGFPLVLSHSGRSGAINYANNVPALAEKYKVITYDRRGVDRSTAPDGTDNADTWVSDLHGLLQHLNIQRAYIGGVSYGSMLSVHFLFTHPDMVEGLIAACGSPFGWGHDQDGRIPQADHRADLPNATAPVLWIFGETDAGFPPSMGEEANALTPDSDLAIAKGVGHSPQTDATDWFNDSILTFLAKVDSRRVPA